MDLEGVVAPQKDVVCCSDEERGKGYANERFVCYYVYFFVLCEK